MPGINCYALIKTGTAARLIEQEEGIALRLKQLFRFAYASIIARVIAAACNGLTLFTR